MCVFLCMSNIVDSTLIYQIPNGSGVREAEGSHDAVRNADGGLPARRPSAELLPQHHLVGRCHRARHRLPTLRDGPPRPRHCRRLSAHIGHF